MSVPRLRSVAISLPNSFIQSQNSLLLRNRHEDSEVDEMLQLRSGRIHAFDDNYPTRLYDDHLAQTMPDGPVEASESCRSSIPQRVEGLVAKPLPIEVAINTLGGSQRSTLHIGHVSVEIIAMNHRSPDVTSEGVRQGRLPSTAATIDRHHDHALLALHLPTAQGLENTLNRVHEPLRMPDEDVDVHRPDRQFRGGRNDPPSRSRRTSVAGPRRVATYSK